MSKSNKFLTTMLLAAAGGAAAAVFIASKTGQAVKDKMSKFVKDYHNNPDAKHGEWVEKATDLKKTAVEKYSDVKHKFETGELRPEDIVTTVKEKAVDLADKLKGSPVAEDALHAAKDVTPAEEEEITIDIDDIATAEASEAADILDAAEVLEEADTEQGTDQTK